MSEGTPVIGVTVADGCVVQSAAGRGAMLSADGELVTLARAYLTANRAYWQSLVKPPYNENETDDHKRLRDANSAAWQAWCDALTSRGITTGDRRALALGLAE